MKDLHSRIDTYLEENLSDYVELTARLCAQPSVSASGEGIEACAELVAEILSQHDIGCEVHPSPGNPFVLGKLTGEHRCTLLFYNHYDVQPPEPLELWTSPPFKPTIRDNSLYARGAKDDKGELISRLAAVDAVRHAMGELPCNFVFLVDGEEEVGSPHLEEFVRQQYDHVKADAAIWEEGGVEIGNRPALLLGVRGILYIELSVQVMQMDAHSGYAHALPNAAWRLHDTLQTLHDASEKIAISGFYDSARKPSKKDLRNFDEWPDLGPYWKKQYGLDSFRGGLEGPEIRYAVFNPTCNIAGIGAGYQGPGTKTVIPSQAKAKVDFRLVPDQDPEDIHEKLMDHLEAEGFGDIRVEVLGKMWPYAVGQDDPFVQMAAESARSVYGERALIGAFAGGSSPMYAVAGPMEIPVVNPGIGYWNNRTHAPDEHIRLEDFHQACRYIARIILGTPEVFSG